MTTHPYIYIASGTVKRSNSPIDLHVAGAMLIDPTLRLWARSASTPADPAPLPVGDNQYSYFIPGYTLCFFNQEQPGAVYHFSGTAGTFYIERTDQDLGDLQWDLENGSGVATHVHGEHFHCYNSELRNYDLFNQLATLPPFIRLSALESPPDHPILSQVADCNIMLVKMDRADVVSVLGPC